MSNFPTKRAYNPGGLVSFQFVHHASVGAFPPMTNGVADSVIILRDDLTWLSAYSTPYTLQFTERAETTAHGVRYLHRITGYVPGDHAEVIAQMQAMDNQYFTALVKDANNRVRLVGGYGYPLLFSAAFDSGSSRADAKGFAYELSGYSIYRAPEYRP